MHKFQGIVGSRLLLAGLCVVMSGASLSAQAQTSIRRVQVLGSKDAVEIEVEASDRIVPKTQVLTGPDRLVVDFPNAVPGGKLRSQSVDRGEVKDVRMGLFQSKPPVTRLVFDLKSAQSYQVFPGRTVIIKVMGGHGASSADDASAGVDDFPPEPPTRPGLVVTNYVAGAERVHLDQAVVKPLEVSFRDGMLSIHSNKATLSEVLFAVQQRTGAEVGIAAGAEQEKVVVDLGPGPAPEILARLLNGSKFNFLILSAANDPRQLDRVILSPRVVSAPPPMAQNVPQNEDAEEEGPAPAPVQAKPVNHLGPPTQVPPGSQPGGQPEVNAPAPQDNTPDQ